MRYPMFLLGWLGSWFGLALFFTSLSHSNEEGWWKYAVLGALLTASSVVLVSEATNWKKKFPGD